jgi:hypothetical protein
VQNTQSTPYVRVGSLRVGTSGLDLGSLPLLVPLLDRGHLFVKDDFVANGPPTGSAPAITALSLWHSILLRLSVAMPPASVCLELFDPTGMGSNLVPFLHLSEVMRSPKVYSRAREIAEQLDRISDHVEMVLQTRLLDLYPTLEEYNRHTGEMRVPYHILCFADFPNSFNEQLLDKLLHIAKNGPKAGVHIVAQLTAQPALQVSDVLGVLLGLGSMVYVHRNGHVTPDRALPHATEAWADQMPSSDCAHRLLAQVGAALTSLSSSLEFGRIAVPAAARWRASSVDGVAVPIGTRGNGEIQTLTLGYGTVHHALIGGMIGAGKSNLLNVIITQLALRYPPEELELWLIDYKEGVEFQDYMRLPQARVVALESEREFGLSILRHLRGIMEERGRLFKDRGGLVNDLRTYRAQTGQRLPRIVLIMDEFQVLFMEDDLLAREAAHILEDVVRRGRAFGLHLVLSSQSPSMAGVYGSRIYNQIGLRIALRCRVQDAQAILGEGNNAAGQLRWPGEAIYNAEMGDPQHNLFLRVALLAPEIRHRYLQEIEAYTNRVQYPAPVTFAGLLPAQLEKNAQFEAQVTAPSWQDYQQPLSVWLGEPVALTPSTTAIFERYTRSNLVAVGGVEYDGYGLLLAALLSIAAQLSPRHVQFYVADLARPASAYAGLFQHLHLPHPLHRVSVEYGGDRGVQPLQVVADHVRERLAGRVPLDQEVFLLIAGLHRWRELRPAEIYGQSEAGKQLLTIAEEGPEVGVHVIAWADSPVTLDRVFRRGGVSAFDLRVIFRLSEGDSNLLLGSSAAARLEDNRALFRHEDWEMRRLEKFKPYRVLNKDTLMKVTARLRDKWHQFASEAAIHGTTNGSTR